MQLPQVGYYRALPIEGIISLNPNMVLVSEQAGPKKTIDNLKKFNGTYFHLYRLPTPLLLKLSILALSKFHNY